MQADYPRLLARGDTRQGRPKTSAKRVLGQGGTAVEVIADRAVALPPLNMNLAQELIRRTLV